MNPLIRKLRHGAPLTEADEDLLSALAGTTRRADRGDIVREGAEWPSIIVAIEGWFCRYKYLESGKRQITSVFLPGDLCEPFGAMPARTDYALGALTPVVVARVLPAALRSAAKTSPRIEEALWWDLLLWDALNREHIVSLGRRSATERLGHFFCEMHLRLELLGMVDQASYEFPLTQADLADLSGLSAVQVNRSIQELRGAGLLSLRERRMTIHHLQALREQSMFDAHSLPLRPRTVPERLADD